MDNDDALVGRILSRREAITLLGGGGLLFLAGCGGGSGSGVSVSATATPVATATASPNATPVAGTACVVRPELTEGPYFVDEKLLRSDIRSDPSTGTVKTGVLLTLNFNLTKLSGSACSALSGATIDVWHADAAGKYSDIASEGTSGQKFLRGYQVTPSDGLVTFTSIFPGWYQGRAVHLHFKIRVNVSGQSYEFTSQLFFNDALATQIYTASPYNSLGTRSNLNASDSIYNQSGGQTLLALTGSNSAGYTGTFNIALDVS